MFSFLYHCQDFYRTWLYIWVTWRVSYKKQELLALPEHLSSPPVFCEVRVAHLFSYLRCPIMCLYSLSSVLWWPLRFPHKTIFGSYLPPVVCRRAHVLFTLFVFIAYSGVQHILCCVFVLFFFVLCTLCCQFLWIVYFWLPPSVCLNHKNSKRITWTY
jgi:hypothetical protein